MLNQLANSPPATHIVRPEREDRHFGTLDRIAKRISATLSGFLHVRNGWMQQFVDRVDICGNEVNALGERGLKETADGLRILFKREGFTEDNIARSFALIRQISSGIMDMRHFNTQILGGRVLLNGMIAEMETGEGKTLTATLAAGTAGLAGIPVHVITVNDYLTGRDAELTGPLYEALGLTVGTITHGMSPEERRAAYSSDVVYCTNKEIAFDYLKDWITLEGRRDPLRLHAEYLYGHENRISRLLLRGLHFAIVDEADSILIDEARTPLIISGPPGKSVDERTFLEQAIDLAQSLEQDIHYRISESGRKVEITSLGEETIREHSLTMGPLWTGAVRRKEIVNLALTALHLFRRDEQYMVRNGKVQIVDEFTGRVMPDRSYERGLHQLIEIKEGCEITKRAETLARISYQRFFRRYLHLAGMTGTAREVSQELLSVYGLTVVGIPTHKRMRRIAYPDRVFRTEKEKWEAIVERILHFHRQRRPLLVGTRSVAASEKAGDLLSVKDVKFQILNAKQDKEEAEIISRAGEDGRITIATNMAGRGTDIKLGEGVAKKQGLHVILTERHEAGRIDRQLAGRCGRLGDPGSYEAILSLDDPIMGEGIGGISGWLARKFTRPGSAAWTFFSRRAILKAQKKVERLHARIRKSLLREDERRGNMLSFSGLSE